MAIHKRWPLCLEAQAKPATDSVTLVDIWIWIHPFLDVVTQGILLCSLMNAHQLGPGFGPLWFYRPWSPHRRRRWGFGIPTSGRSTRHEMPSPYAAIHYTWVFLDPHDRYKATKVCEEWALYHQLRLQQAVTTSLRQLRVTREAPGNPTKLWKDRALLYGCALLRFDFYYGDFLRWMGGEYTNRSKDWMTMFQTMVGECVQPPPIHWPTADFDPWLPDMYQRSAAQRIL
jgi:hypothetical protein